MQTKEEIFQAVQAGARKSKNEKNPERAVDNVLRQAQLEVLIDIRDALMLLFTVFTESAVVEEGDETDERDAVPSEDAEQADSGSRKQT